MLQLDFKGGPLIYLFEMIFFEGVTSHFDLDPLPPMSHFIIFLANSLPLGEWHTFDLNDSLLTLLFCSNDLPLFSRKSIYVI